jgi:hypothetical protein
MKLSVAPFREAVSPTPPLHPLGTEEEDFMEVSINTEIIERLSSNGVLAYVAVKIAEGSEATTAALAGLVRCKTGNMLDGLKDAAVAAPELVAKAPKNRWRCGVVKAGEGVVLQNLESERYRLFVDDLSKFWNFLNPALPFEMSGKDGVQIRRFLSEHQRWTQEDWRKALNHRKTSIVVHRAGARTQPLWVWVGRLDEYAAGPLDRFNKPAEGGGKHGEAATIRQGNREAVAAAVANA